MAAISGVGAWYPEEVRRNEDWPPDFSARAKSSQHRTFNDIPSAEDPALRVTEDFLRAEADDPFLGAKERRVAPLSVSAVEAETNAGRIALTDAGLEPHQIDCVISYSAVPDRPTPPAASDVAARLGIVNTLAFGIDVACASALVQISTACALIRAGEAEHVLLTQSHLMLRTFPLMHPASPCLGDASTALVVSRQGKWPVLGSYSVTHGDHYRSVTWVRERAPAEPDPEDTPWWSGGGAFRVGSLDIDGAKALQRDTVAYGADTIRELLRRTGVDAKRIGLLASAEPRGFIPRGILRVLGLPETIASSVYETRGHLGASGCIANLAHSLRVGKTDGVDLAVLYAQGAGFTRASVLLQMDGGATTR